MAKNNEIVDIKAANFARVVLPIVGTAPLVMHKFGQKAQLQMQAAQTEPEGQRKGKKKREPRNYDDDFKGAMHISRDGWIGIPCAAFRTAMIDACRTVGIVMTRAKMALFIVPDGFENDGTALVRLDSDTEPDKHIQPVRLETGVADIRCRPMWHEWSAKVTIEFDEDMITATAVANLLDRAGRQVGLMEGRPFSKNSVGQGWGTFMVKAGSNE